MTTLYSFNFATFLSFIPASLPKVARANVVGNINGHEFGVSGMTVSVSRGLEGSLMDAELLNIPMEVRKWKVYKI